MTPLFDTLIVGAINNQKEGIFMSRKARVRAKHQPHHIMSRSIPELDLFNCNEDKEYYLNLIKASTLMYNVKVLAYCIMDNHIHMLVHPQGGDIAKFMRKINNPYAKYYNRTYKRRGHLFGERYKNIIIKDETHLLRTSTYIHNNAKDLLWQGYKSIEDYPYSSIKDYIRTVQGRGIADPSYIFGLMGGGWSKAQNDYMGLLELLCEGDEVFEREMIKAFNKGFYETDKKDMVRNQEPEKVISALAKLLGISNPNVRHIKYAKNHKVFKHLTAICLRIFCDMSLSDMTKEFRGHTSSTIGIYAKEGYKSLSEDKRLFNQIMSCLS